jgi:hypothetical protein
LRSQLILLQTLFGVVAAASTFSDDTLDSPVVLLLTPGVVAAIALSGNVHAFPIWVAACENFLFISSSYGWQLLSGTKSG